MSSSSSNHHWIYDVFINFRGEDVRSNFVSHLYAALSNAGIHTFMDHKLRKGTELGPELLRAIEGSELAIVVFSKNYANSRWCLKELVKIMECYASYGQVVLPIFYDVDPSDVRQQYGDFGKALEALAQSLLHIRRGNVLTELGKWEQALTQVANFSGWDMRNSRNEAEQVTDILKQVLAKLGNTFLSVAKFPVGLESRKEEVIKFIENKSRKGCVIGIWGMGGSGKTTIAKAIYNQIHRRFVDRSFIENIREVCETDSRGHVHLQEQILFDVLKSKVKIHSVGMGITMIEKRLCGKRTLIVLDDVNNFEQLNTLCGNLKWIGLGSVLIVTTRDVRILDLLEVDCVFEMKEMDESESLELFSWHAFREASPRKDFTKLSKNVVAYCGGLPLALEVLGSYLYQRRKKEWTSVLSKLKLIPNDQVQEKLRISFDGLGDHMEKDIFLDICCFFIGKDRTYVTKILNDCGLYADIGITILLERSLIKVEKKNKLAVHDLLRDMGREIVRQTSPKELEKRSRLWVQEEVIDVLTEHSGTEAIEGLALKLKTTSRACFNTKAFEKMKRLRLLQLDHVQLDGDYDYLHKNLRWVCWQGFPLKYIPGNFYQENAVAIDLKHSNLKYVWKEPQLLVKLKFLNLSHSKFLTNTPDFSKLPNLEKLILKDCPSLHTIHQSIGDLHKLVLINFKDCINLSNLPMNTYKLKSVKTLILSGSSKVDRLEEDIMQMESLVSLIADNTAIKQVPFSILKSKSIGYISLCGYEGLARDVFPSIIWSWMSPSMNPLSHIHPFWDMSSSLVSMDVHANNLSDLAPRLSTLSKLRSVLVQCDTQIQLSKEVKKIMDGVCGVNFTESGIASSTSQISQHPLRCDLIGMGSYQDVFNTLNKSILEGLTTNESCDDFLPNDNYPYWLTHTGEGYSVPFIMPEESDCCMKGMILCVVYSSPSKSTAVECLVSVLMVNYTKCTFQMFKQDTIISFNDEDWLGLTSNLGPGDNVEIFVAFGHGLTVNKTTIYLIYDQSLTVKIEQSPEVKMEQSPEVKMEQSPEVIVKPSPKVTREPSPKVTREPSPNVKTEPSMNSKKNNYTRLTKRLRECLCLSGHVMLEPN